MQVEKPVHSTDIPNFDFRCLRQLGGLVLCAACCGDNHWLLWGRPLAAVGKGRLKQGAVVLIVAARACVIWGYRQLLVCVFRLRKKVTSYKHQMSW